jgi:hypothetical protein
VNNDIKDKLSIDDLKIQLAQAKKAVPVYVPYEHYRGGRYLVIGHTVDKNSNIIRVVYVREEDKGRPDQVPFDCPLLEWEETVCLDPLTNEPVVQPRFRMVEGTGN